MVDSAPTSKDVQRFGLWLVLALFVFSGSLGSVLAHRYLETDTELVRLTRSLHERGAHLSIEDCVGESISWWQGCQAGEAVCGELVGHIATSCLSGSDRGLACDALGDRLRSTHYDYEGCVGRGLDPRGARSREARKAASACGDAYRAVDDWCQGLKEQR